MTPGLRSLFTVILLTLTFSMQVYAGEGQDLVDANRSLMKGSAYKASGVLLRRIARDRVPLDERVDNEDAKRMWADYFGKTSAIVYEEWSLTTDGSGGYSSTIKRLDQYDYSTFIKISTPEVTISLALLSVGLDKVRYHSANIQPGYTQHPRSGFLEDMYKFEPYTLLLGPPSPSEFAALATSAMTRDTGETAQWSPVSSDAQLLFGKQMSSFTVLTSSEEDKSARPATSWLYDWDFASSPFPSQVALIRYKDTVPQISAVNQIQDVGFPDGIVDIRIEGMEMIQKALRESEKKTTSVSVIDDRKTTRDKRVISSDRLEEAIYHILLYPQEGHATTSDASVESRSESHHNPTTESMPSYRLENVQGDTAVVFDEPMTLEAFQDMQRGRRGISPR